MKQILNVFNEVNTTQYVDAQTGELLEEKKTNHRSVSKHILRNKRNDFYFNVYYENKLFAEMLALSKAELSTLLACASATEAYNESMLERFAYPGNMVVANARFRQWICKVSNLVDSSVKAALSSLVKKGFLQRDPQTKGVYYLNANVVFKGYSSIRTKLLNASVYSESITDDEQQEDSWAEATGLLGSESDAAYFNGLEEETEEESDGEQETA